MGDRQISLRVARAMTELTQEELAEKLGVSRVTVQAWEAGKAIPRFDQARKICELARISMDVLFLPN